MGEMRNAYRILIGKHPWKRGNYTSFGGSYQGGSERKLYKDVG